MRHDTKFPFLFLVLTAFIHQDNSADLYPRKLETFLAFNHGLNEKCIHTVLCEDFQIYVKWLEVRNN
jgi:hypothetical protein